MDIITIPADMQRQSASVVRSGRKIAFVPTMGFLHEGHLSLIRLARGAAEVCVVSIFVNPAQFGPGEDLDRYPRAFEQDAEACRREGVDILFHPPPELMYPAGSSVFVDENRLSRVLCGAERPGHFRGVLTVVAKLFNIVRPDLAVFGRKDAQQLRLIERMAADLNFPVEILSAPIVREADGLAMSSRNRYLDRRQRERALSLHRALRRAARAVAGGETDAAELRRILRETMSEAGGVNVDYAEVVDPDSLQPAETVDRPVLAAIAARVGGARLIDNALLEPRQHRAVPGE